MKICRGIEMYNILSFFSPLSSAFDFWLLLLVNVGWYWFYSFFFNFRSSLPQNLSYFVCVDSLHACKIIKMNNENASFICYYVNSTFSCFDIIIRPLSLSLPLCLSHFLSSFFVTQYSLYVIWVDVNKNSNRWNDI